MRKLYLLLLLTTLTAGDALALSGKEHAADMQRIFPFAQCARNKKVTDFYHLVNAYLDYPGQNPQEQFDRSAPKRPLSIASHPKFGQIHWLGKHRIWFHWGFNTDPRQFPPIVNSLEQAVQQGVIRESDLPEFWTLMNQEISRRNRTLMNEGARVFGFGQLGTISVQQRKQLNGLVTVLYSIHVVGDHKTPDKAIVAPLDRVYADISNAIDNLAGKEPSNMLLAKELKRKLKAAQGSPDAYLDAMEKGFGPFLLALKGEGYDYKARFEKQGYVVRIKDLQFRI